MEYFHKHFAWAKGAWINKEILDLFEEQFVGRTREYYEEAIKVGAITVNGKIVKPNYRVKHQDYFYHEVHHHEPEPKEIKKIFENDDYVVINKPNGMVCHPVGAYNNYSVTKALFGDKAVGCIHRLDLPVTGVLIIAKENKANMYKMFESVKKTYVAKVKGDFPDKITVNKPILNEKKNKISIIDEERGKESKTIFTKLKSSDGYSLVQCQPITGRTHQIRIHLKSLGFPIINDYIYGDIKRPEIKENNNYCCNVDISNFEDKEKYEFIKRNCVGENNRIYLFKDSYICLHAWRYFFNGETYEAELPSWANF